MKAWHELDAVEQHPDKVSGAWVFRGTRVPVAALEQVEAVLDYEVASLSPTERA
jgi:hypothetical protein